MQRVMQKLLRLRAALQLVCELKLRIEVGLVLLMDDQHHQSQLRRL